MNFEYQIRVYNGKILDISKLPEYDQAALEFFVDSNKIQDPFLNFTVQHDITKAQQTFLEISKNNNTPKPSFTSYLVWCLIKSLAQISQYNWRYVNTNWYYFSNLPVYIPIATHTKSRLSGIFLQNTMTGTYNDFVPQYINLVKNAQSGKTAPFTGQTDFLLAHNIGNLPTIRFSGMKLHTSRQQACAPMFYFGQRYVFDDRIMMPFFAQIHHANGDPVLLAKLLDIFDHVSQQKA